MKPRAVSRRCVTSAILASALMVGVALLGALVVSGGVLPAPGSGPTLPASEIRTLSRGLEAQANAALAMSPFGGLQRAIESGDPSALALSEGLAPFLGTYSAQAYSVTPAQWSAVLALVVNGNAHPLEVTPAWGAIAGLITIGGLVVLAAICASTAGVGCLAALVVIGIAIVVANDLCGISKFFGSDYGCAPPPPLQAQANNVAKLIVQDYGNVADVAAVGETNLLSALNQTGVALGYEAASAALTVLNYTNFPYNLVEDRSGISAEMATVLWADEVTLASITAKAMAAVSYYEGTGDTSGYAASIDFGLAGASSGGRTWGTICPVWTGGATSGSGTLTVCDYGAIFPASTVFTISAATSSTDYYVANDSSLNVYNAGGSAATLTFVPIAANTSWTNVSVPAGTWDDNETLILPQGGQNGMSFWIKTGGDLELFFSDAWVPGNTVTYGSYGATTPGLEWVNDNPLPSNGIGTAGGINAIGYCVGFGGACTGGSAAATYSAELLGGNTNATDTGGYAHLPVGAGAQQNLGTYLEALATVGMTEGDTYWAFVHYNLGYTAESQVPAACIVPNPSQVLPPNIPISTLEGLNLTNMLGLYQAALYHLSLVFNGTWALNAGTICGKHPVWNDYNTSLGFGEYASGYIFINGSGLKSSDGKVSQVLATPSTWNVSGTFYLAPTVANLGTLVANKTYVLPSANPVIAIDEDYLNQSYANVFVNRLGPLNCPFGTGSTTACYQDPIYGSTLEVTGNSTASGDLKASLLSASTHTLGAGDAVYITACFVAVNGTAAEQPTYVETPSCTFNEQTLNVTGWTCDGSVLYSGGVPVGSCAPSTGPILIGTSGCGGIWLSWLAGPIASGLSFLGSLACPVAEVLAIIGLLVFVLIVAWVCVEVVRVARG